MQHNVILINNIFRILNMLINCSICLGDINLFDKEVSILNCGHFFHSHCLNDWLARQMNCPEFRAKVTRDNFVRNIFPKVNKETACKFKSLEDRCEILRNESFLPLLKCFFHQLQLISHH